MSIVNESGLGGQICYEHVGSAKARYDVARKVRPTFIDISREVGVAADVHAQRGSDVELECPAGQVKVLLRQMWRNVLSEDRLLCSSRSAGP